MEIGKPSRTAGSGPAPDQGPPVSPVEFRLDPSSGVPPYLQLVQQVERTLRLGYLQPGDQLPRVRDVVSSLAINPNTVLKAYKELEHKGLAVGRPGQGTFVQSGLGQPPLAELAALRRELVGWLGNAHAAGLDGESIVALVTTTIRDFLDGRGREPAVGPAGAEGVA